MALLRLLLFWPGVESPPGEMFPDERRIDPLDPYREREVMFNPSWSNAGPTVVDLVRQEVEKDRTRGFVAIDAGQPHHTLVSNWRDIPKAPGEVDILESCGRVEFILRDGTPSQLSLPMDLSDGLHGAAIRALRDMTKHISTLRRWSGLRHWAVMLDLASKNGRQGWFRWTVDEHLKSLGYSERRRRDPKVREKAARMGELFTRFELALLDKDGTRRECRPLLTVGSRFERLEGSAWTLDGADLHFNPLLYSGVRNLETGALGSNWFPGPEALARIDDKRFPHALPTILLLSIRFTWLGKKQREHLDLAGRKLLDFAGIPFEPRRASVAWDKLTKTLDELRRVDAIARFEWRKGKPCTLDGICRLYLPERALDFLQRGVRPRELPAAQVPETGDELRTWRTGQDWTQAETAERLGVSTKTITRNELRGKRRLTRPMAEALRR